MAIGKSDEALANVHMPYKQVLQQALRPQAFWPPCMRTGMVQSRHLVVNCLGFEVEALLGYRVGSRQDSECAVIAFELSRCVRDHRLLPVA